MHRRRLAVLLVLPLVLAGCDWAQVGFNGANTGADPRAIGFNASTVGALHQAWTVSEPGAASVQLVAAGDTVYSSAHLVPLGSPLPYFGGCSTSVGTGTTVARPPIASCPSWPGASPSTSPAVGASGAFEALDAATGAVRWGIGGRTFSTPSPGVDCSNSTEATGPAIVQQTIDLLVSRDSCVFNGEDTVPSTHTYTLDASTGVATETAPQYDGEVSAVTAANDGSVYAVRTWSATDDVPLGVADTTSIVGPGGVLFTAPGAPGDRALGPLAVDATSVYSVDDTGTLRAVDRSTGAVRWSASIGVAPGFDGPKPVPSVAYGRVFVSNGSKLLAFDRAGVTGCTTGSDGTACNPVWSTTLPDATSIEAPALRSGRVFVRSGTTLSAFAASTGAALWSAPLGTSSGDVSTLGSPSIAGSVVFVGAQDGHLLAFDVYGRSGCSGAPTTCSPLWSAVLAGAPGTSRPIIAGDAVYLASAHDSSGVGIDITKFVR